jgi:hypothetical protein
MSCKRNYHDCPTWASITNELQVLNTTAKLHHRTPLPPGTTLAQTLNLFRNHDVLIHLDPELAHYETTTPPPDANPSTRFYKITDHMHTLPRGLWDTTVSFDAEITDTDNGVKWVIKAPMGLVQTSHWAVVPALETDGTEENTLVLVEDVLISCSRLLVGTVRGKCEDNWKGVHARFVEQLGTVKE